MPTPISMFEKLRDEFVRYYDTPYRLRSENLMKERRNLLDQEGSTWRQPWIEVMREYAKTGVGLEEAVRAAGGSEDLTNFVKCGLIQFDDLFIHQRDALRSATQGRNVVVSAGTGSGKTESFLMPVLSALIEESRSWGSTPPLNDGWWREGNEFIPRRNHGTGRPSAVRALVLYPMNALVEDQLVRLRRALDSDLARLWLDSNRQGNRFFFGRYTGKTPVSGRPENENAIKKLARHLGDLERRSAKVAGDYNKRYYLPRLDGAEVVSRWDMQDSAPDILITNYTMLNIMLLREVEDTIFEQTKKWIETSPDNVFHVVVDELHMYRGTAGTEVAYLLRSLLSRLGLQPDSPQVRFLATSASLGSEEESRRFLRQFFGAPSDSFDVHAGSVVAIGNDCPTDLMPVADQLREWAAPEAGVRTADQAADLLRSARVREVLWKVTDTRTIELADLDRRLFPNLARTADTVYSEPLRGLVNAIEASQSQSSAGFDPPRLRSHLFLRNVQGVWACTDPQCSAAQAEYPEHFPDPDRTVGKLFVRPRHRCDCGKRVLRLLYCQTCGDVFLGGFLAPPLAPGERMGGREFLYLLPELGQLEGLPENYQQGETCRTYTMFWPRAREESELASQRTWTREGYTFEFKKARLESSTGELKIGAKGFSGWTFEVSDRGVADSKIDLIPPLPIHCPQCGAEREFTASGRKVYDRSRTMSPIRGMSTGFEKFSQVLIDAMVRELRTIEDSARRLVLFSDSRQDAAKLSAGIEKRHYQHLNREVIVDSLRNKLGVDFDAAVRFAMEGDRSDEARRAWTEMGVQHPGIRGHLTNAMAGDDAAHVLAMREIEKARVGIPVPSLELLVDAAATALGIPPAGSDYSVTELERKDMPSLRWDTLYDWPRDENDAPLPGRKKSALESASHERLREKINIELSKECIRNVFGGDGRDLESLALAKPSVHMTHPLAPPQGMDEQTLENVVNSCVRILGESRLIQGVRGEPNDLPASVKKYLEAVGYVHGIDSAALRRAVEAAWGDSVLRYLIQPEHLVLKLPGMSQWECARCRRRHLDDSAGVCNSCMGPLPAQPVPALNPELDYYAWLAGNSTGQFRLHCEELSGQTDDDDAPARQARFQDIFLDDENQLVDGIDLLSVTTTMEAGVDIGSLRAVVMSSMPPQRFNYQQRVGRAGRRSDPFAFALTTCRDRTHDEYYFNHPESITNDTPPSPYIDVSRAEILKRSLAAVALRDAFRELGHVNPDVDLGRNVHGEFGSTDDWATNSGVIVAKLGGMSATIGLYLDNLLVEADDALRQRRDEFLAWACCSSSPNLVDEIDATNPSDSPVFHLSQHLAETGVLPMFGFPTRVRYMYLNRPNRVYPWPPNKTIDRQIELAITEYAPGAETVRDKRVHTAIGLAAFEPKGNHVAEVDNPFGRQYVVALCRRCGSIEEVVTEKGPTACKECSAADEGVFSVFKVAEPAGFRSTYRPLDFEGSFTRRARSTTPRMSPEMGSMTSSPVGRGAVQSGRGFVYVINDNSSRLYSFAPFAEGKGKSWVHVETWNDKATMERLEIKYPDSILTDQAWVGALGTRKSTDSLLVGLDNVLPGLDLRPFDPARRGAWYSLGFLLRSVAVRQLDVGPDELNVGYTVRHVGGNTRVEVFLADQLENGAGYCTRLGDPTQFASLVLGLDSFIAELQRPPHTGCDSSCPACIRDYTNLIYHPLLDWRLGRDLFDLLMNRDLDLGEWKATEEALAGAFADDFNGSVRLLDGNVYAVETSQSVVIVKHPFEEPADGVDPEQCAMTERLDRAYVDAYDSADGRAVTFASSFDLQRRPGWVAAKVAGL